MTLNTVQIVQVRACDLPESGTVRKHNRPGEAWQHVYEVTRGGQESAQGADDITTISVNDLDERYVLLRLSLDPAMSMAKGTRTVAPHGAYEKRLFAVVNGARPLEKDVYDDQLQVAKAHDLWDLQVVVPVTDWQADS